ncbi:MAG: hypothetical protein L6R40_008598 [Gallowayella cf. fulva]|nr:MAG: hypothetical protein L6R40_008598 [Xanthomendoza cf. fulva]
MARQKKGEEQAKDSAILQISIEDFVRTRDAVVTGLATLQSAVQDLSRAYIAHTNTVIGKGTGSSHELLNFANPLGGENGLFGGRTQTSAAPNHEQSTKGEGKKRKRAPPDKNAPKRPRTPYFLYMQFARDGISKDMGPESSAKQVQDEGTRRWNSMGPEEKNQWAELYGCNYAAYKKKVQAYKAGLPIPEFTDEEARQLYNEERKVGAAPVAAQDASSDHDENLDSDEESDSSSEEEESPEPPKVASPPKSPRASKRGKGAKGKVEKRVSPIKELPLVERSRKSPEADKKKKGSKKSDAKATVGVTEPKKEAHVNSASSPIKAKKDSEAKPKRKKRKSEATDV